MKLAVLLLAIGFASAAPSIESKRQIAVSGPLTPPITQEFIDRMSGYYRDVPQRGRACLRFRHLHSLQN